MYNILICDDQPDIVNALKIYLAPEGYRLFSAYTGQEALQTVREQEIHLVLLDVMMPVMDGITATAKIREFSNIPIILLTAKSETEDMVLGLNVGADDYITKPFVPVEVLARVRSQLRRYAQLGSRPENVSGTITIGGITLDDRTKTVTVGLAAAIVEALTGFTLIQGMAPISEGFETVGEIAIILAGAFPLVAVLTRLLRKPLMAAGRWLGINDAAAAGLIASLANSIAAFGLVKEMNPRGKVVNIAFAVSAAFVFGDHLGYTAGFAPEMLLPMIAGKLAGGISAVAVAMWLTGKE